MLQKLLLLYFHLLPTRFTITNFRHVIFSNRVRQRVKFSRPDYQNLTVYFKFLKQNQLKSAALWWLPPPPDAPVRRCSLPSRAALQDDSSSSLPLPPSCSPPGERRPPAVCSCFLAGPGAALQNSQPSGCRPCKITSCG